MKRLLVAPLLITLASCSLPFDKSKKDVVVKTDLNETYIVKDSTVTIKPWSKLEAIVQLQKNHPVQICRDRLEKGTYINKAENLRTTYKVIQ